MLMKFIQIDKNRYLIKGSNNIVVDEDEKLKLEKKELIIKDIASNECQGEATQKIVEIDKKLKGKNGKKSETKSVEKTEQSI